MNFKLHHRKLILLHTKVEELLNNDDFTINGRTVITENKYYKIVDSQGYYSGYGIDHSKLQKHLCGINVSANALDDYDAFCLSLFDETFKNNETPISGKKDRLGFKKFAQKIGFKNSEANFIVDCHLSKHLLTYNTFSKSIVKSEKLVTEMGGMYSVYRFDKNEATEKLGYPHGLISECRLSVRYPVPFKKTVSLKDDFDYRLRCKMNIPGYPGKKPKGKNEIEPIRQFQYDGYVSRVERGRGKNKWMHWLFQERPYELAEHSEDLILMHTKPKPLELEPFEDNSITKKYEFYTGRMSYQDQSVNVIPTMTKILLVKHLERKVEKNSLSSTLEKLEFLHPELFYVPSQEEHPFVHSPRLIDTSNMAKWNALDKLAIPRLLASLWN